MKPDKFEQVTRKILNEVELVTGANMSAIAWTELLQRIPAALTEASSVSFPSEKIIDSGASDYTKSIGDDCLTRRTSPHTPVAEHIWVFCGCDIYTAFKAGIEWAKSQCQPTNAHKELPESLSGRDGAISRDRPREIGTKPLEALSYADMYEQLYKAFCVTSKELSEMDPSEAKDMLYKIECGATAWRAAEARLLKGRGK